MPHVCPIHNTELKPLYPDVLWCAYLSPEAHQGRDECSITFSKGKWGVASPWSLEEMFLFPGPEGHQMLPKTQKDVDAFIKRVAEQRGM
jgi:hypothetical protein